MTPANTGKRETSILYRGRHLIVELHPGFFSIGPKGKGAQHRVAVEYGAIYEMGMKLRAREAAENGQPRRRLVKRGLF